MLDPGVVFQPPGLLRSREAITGARSLTANDNGLLLEATSGSGTIDGSAVTLGAGFKFTVYNSGSGSPVFDPASTQTIRLPTGTVSTVTILQGQGLTLVSDGTNWIGVLGIGFGSTPGTAVTVRDNVFTIQDDADPTKQLQFQCSSIATGTTRTLTAPDANITLAGINLAQTWTAAQTFNTGTTTIATADINAGAIDGTAIGASSASTGAFTTLTALAATVVTSGTLSQLTLGASVASGYSGLVMHANGAQNNWLLGVQYNVNGGFEITPSTAAGGTTFTTPVLTVTTTTLTLASGINLAMSGASTLTTGTGDVNLNGRVIIASNRLLDLGQGMLNLTSYTTAETPAGLITAMGDQRFAVRTVDNVASYLDGQSFGSVLSFGNSSNSHQYTYQLASDPNGRLLYRTAANSTTWNAWALKLTAAGALSLNGGVSVSNTSATITSGTGTPEAAVTAPVGSLFMRTDGGAATTLYVKESGAGNTGWVAK